MTGPSPAFKIGQEVEIIGPDHLNGDYIFSGKTKITMLWNHSVDGMLYSNDDLPWYPASSLRLVQQEPELKIGDWVQVLEQPTSVHGELTGQIVQIDHFHDEDGRPHAGGWYYYASDLRKLTPEEVAKHTRKNIGEFTATLKLDTSEFEAGIDKMKDKLWKLQVEQRLAAIERRQDKIDHWIDRFAVVGGRWKTEKADLEKRLAFLEASQKGKAEDKAELKAKQLSILRDIACVAWEFSNGHDVDGPHIWQLLGELKRIEKQIAEGQ